MATVLTEPMMHLTHAQRGSKRGETSVDLGYPKELNQLIIGGLGRTSTKKGVRRSPIDTGLLGLALGYEVVIEGD